MSDRMYVGKLREDKAVWAEVVVSPLPNDPGVLICGILDFGTYSGPFRVFADNQVTLDYVKRFFEWAYEQMDFTGFWIPPEEISFELLSDEGA